jgi:dephospho-CoA kinase
MGNDNAGVFRIGLTGGIASGKTAVGEMFARLGVPVIDTDEIARQIVAPGQPALDAIVAAFGTDVLTPDGELDRPGLRRRIFADPDQRKMLESILHPRIMDRALEISASAGGPYQVMVVPLLLETGFRQLVDRVLVVDCPESMQQDRLAARDQADPEQVARIMAAQLGRAERVTAADDVIDNAGSLEKTRQQVAALHRLYTELAIPV